MPNVSTSNITYPTVLYLLRFCGGSYRYVLREELSMLTVPFTMEQRIQLTAANNRFRIRNTANPNAADIDNLAKVLLLRPGNNTLRLDPLPPIPASLPGDPITGNTGGSSGGGQAGGSSGGGQAGGSSGGGQAGSSLQLSYYLYDHLGNTRMVFHTVLKVDEEDPTYVPEYLADYYPYGKILREWLNCTGERYLTTQHERDIETGYDYRGARFYDADLGRFLSVDPLAAEYAGWSGYNYVLGNPVRLVDMDGRSVDDIVFYNSKGQEVKRVVTNQRYEVYVDLNDNSNYTLAPMPNIVVGFEAPKYQKYDYLIAAHTAIFNNATPPTTSNGLELDGEQPVALSPTLVKSIILKETEAGTINGYYNQKGMTDIMQANVQTQNNEVVTGDDWGDYKSALGLIQGGSATPEQSIFAGIRILYMKGLIVESVSYEDGKPNSNSQVSWRGGNLNSWWHAVKRYNASENQGSYVQKVFNYWNNSFFSKNSTYYEE